ncbi:peptide ABC transporter permease [Anoxybacter fermentans]|uniref:Peptide ABC transporter permease n=1 Tax=Anoxybacter fermentans TaxID=1323375 RepID=A0A3Q9HPS3_9FIRM|nr:oligopeptide ABC transporter permease [Anoxybacter fermentans]AZR72930.1 peptide ABC transporter permease [Anoxybacter fermentans]
MQPQNSAKLEDLRHGLTEKSQSYFSMVFWRFLKHKLAIIGLIIIGVLLIMTIFSDLISKHDITEQDILNRFQPPSTEFWMGTDELGRDVFARILAGGKISLSLGFIVSITSVIIGSFIGAISGYFGGWLDTVLMRFVDFMISLPRLAVLLVVAYMVGPGFTNMVVVLVLFGWMGIARIVRAQVLSLKEQEFVQAARALGVSTPRIIFSHILPNTLAPIIVSATLGVGSAILSESYLSYLGLGIQPPTPSWGNMLINARQYLSTAPWLALWPGMFIFCTILAFNFIGDGLRDAFDPKLKGR